MHITSEEMVHVSLGAASAYLGNPWLPVAYIGINYARQPVVATLDSSCGGVVKQGFLYGIGYWGASLLLNAIF